MQQAERLLKIINLIRNRRTVLTASQIADRLGVSTRTIYRDIQKLEAGGVPLEGEAGVGYRLTRGFDLPPLMFDSEEVEALILGMRMVAAWGDEQLAASASSALNKIIGILPPELKELEENTPLNAPAFVNTWRSPNSKPIRTAIKNRNILNIEYVDAKERSSSRTIWPLGLFFWGNVWTLVSWCCLRKDYRAFRIDRIQKLAVLSDYYPDSEKPSIKHYLGEMKRATFPADGVKHP
jgi:predicted DNA-binding transcriptional regulator YafY